MSYLNVHTKEHSVITSSQALRSHLRTFHDHSISNSPMSGHMYTSTVSDTSRLFRDRTTSEKLCFHATVFCTILKLSDTYQHN